jgi:ABC-type glycerol-3-phosphate transport system substrate-binding protein
MTPLHLPTTTRVRSAAAALAAALLLAACGGDAGASGQPSHQAEARQDSARSEQKALRDAGVSVDTQKIDTNGVPGAPTEDD